MPKHALYTKCIRTARAGELFVFHLVSQHTVQGEGQR